MISSFLWEDHISNILYRNMSRVPVSRGGGWSELRITALTELYFYCTGVSEASERREMVDVPRPVSESNRLCFGRNWLSVVAGSPAWPTWPDLPTSWPARTLSFNTSCFVGSLPLGDQYLVHTDGGGSENGVWSQERWKSPDLIVKLLHSDSRYVHSYVLHLSDFQRASASVIRTSSSSS